MREQEPPFADILRNLHALLESERDIVQDARRLGRRLERSEAGPGETRLLLGRMESLLGKVLENQSTLMGQLESLAAERGAMNRLEELVLRLIDRLPPGGLADLPGQAAHKKVN